MSEPTGQQHGQHAEHGTDAGTPARHAGDHDELAARLQVEYWAAMAETARGGARLTARLRAL